MRFTHADLRALAQKPGYTVREEPTQRRLPAVLAPIPEPKRSKYGAKKCERHGRTFDSIAEADRASSLLLLERAHMIRGLGFQPTYALHAANDSPVCNVKWDFVYFENGSEVCEDTKGHMTAVFRLKRKLFLQQYPHITLKVADKHGNIKPVRARYPKRAA